MLVYEQVVSFWSLKKFYFWLAAINFLYLIIH